MQTHYSSPMKKIISALKELYRWRIRVAPITQFEIRVNQVQDTSMLGLLRLRSIYTSILSLSAKNIPGALVECGVARGGSARLMYFAMKDAHYDRDLWFFDSFQGMPAPSSRDPDFQTAAKFEGKCRGDRESLEAFFRERDIDKSVHIIEGWYENTLKDIKIQNIAFLHIDCDWHDSVAQCLKAFYDSVVVNGYVQIDDYYTWDGCRAAVDSFLANLPKSYCARRVDQSAILIQKIE